MFSPSAALLTERELTSMAKPTDNTIVIAFKQRLLPTKRQHKALAVICENQRQLYNGALQHRIEAYNKSKKLITYDIQQSELTKLRRDLHSFNLPLPPHT